MESIQRQQIDKQGSIWDRLASCIKERRLPSKLLPSYWKRYIPIIYYPYILRLKIQAVLYNREHRERASKINKRYLYAAPIGVKEKIYLEKIIRKFGHEDFDYLIFVYDDTEFSEPVFARCTFIREKRFKWYCGKVYLTPDFCKKYDYIFFWDGDIDIQDFSYKNFIDIMERNNLEMAQPSLCRDSHYSIPITLRRKRYKVGRFCDFVEVMVPVFTFEAWFKFWQMLEKDYNYYGWGYDDLARSFCNYHNMGIVDQECVRHTKSLCRDPSRPEERKIFFDKHKKYKKAARICYGRLK